MTPPPTRPTAAGAGSIEAGDEDSDDDSDDVLCTLPPRFRGRHTVHRIPAPGRPGGAEHSADRRPEVYRAGPLGGGRGAGDGEEGAAAGEQFDSEDPAGGEGEPAAGDGAGVLVGGGLRARLERAYCVHGSGLGRGGGTAQVPLRPCPCSRAAPSAAPVTGPLNGARSRRMAAPQRAVTGSGLRVLSRVATGDGARCGREYAGRLRGSA